MIKSTLLVSTLLTVIAQGVTAQSASTGATNDYAFCADRPAEPEYLSAMSPRESNRKILIQRIYISMAFENVISSSDCSCASRFPSWDLAIEEFLQEYAHIDSRWELLEATSRYTNEMDRLRNLAQPICDSIGHW